VVSPTKADKRRAVLVDLAIGVGLPVLGMILFYIPQGHRFDIYEDVGCWFTYTPTWPIYPFFFLPPVFIGLVSGTYATLTIIAFYKNRSQCLALLSNDGNASSGRFIRLMCLASADVLFVIPLGLLHIGLQTRANPVYPWISWEYIHIYYSHVDQFPAVIWRSNPLIVMGLESSRWTVVFCAFVFFGFFGFADEARRHYRLGFQFVAKRVGMSTGSSGSGDTSRGFLGSTGVKSKGVGTAGKVRPIIPVFVHRQMLRPHDSLDSFTDISVGDGSALNQKSDPEKQDSYLTLSYGAMSIADVGGTLADVKDEAPTSPASSSASSVSQPPPAHTHLNPRDHIEISSVHRSSSYIESSHSLATAV
jgi:pheromone a factor receptor